MTQEPNEPPGASGGSLANSDEAADILAKGIAEMLRIAAEPEWIPVTERLPDEPTVLARDQFGYCCQMGFIGGEFRSLLTRIPQPKYQSPVTHWMPLPAPPTESK